MNINAEMNYWPAEVCGLSECHEALLDFIPTLCKERQGDCQENVWLQRVDDAP
ncbi:MAG: glycosyl hydrolase family 95 catalytic domain-containing protein [Roseburia intestinalis]